MDISQALREAAAALTDIGDTPRLDAEMLMAEALGVDRSTLLLKHMRDPAPPGFDALLARRLAHEPVAYILGQQQFWGLDLAVSPAVLIPRGDSETLIEAALAAFDGREAPGTILDLGTGSGALLLAALCEWPGARGIGMDASEAALGVAQANGAALVPAERCEWRLDSWHATGWVERMGRSFDLVLANPPYVADDAVLAPNVREHEPHSALFAGPQGLDDYRVLIPALPELLAPGGVAVLEIGHDQAEPVSQIAAKAGFEASVRRDLADQPRAITLRHGRIA